MPLLLASLKVENVSYLKGDEPVYTALVAKALSDNFVSTSCISEQAVTLPSTRCIINTVVSTSLSFDLRYTTSLQAVCCGGLSKAFVAPLIMRPGKT